MPLRPYQELCVRKVHEALREVNKVCFVAPTGGGKGYMLGWWTYQIAQRERRALVVTNQRRIVSQLNEHCVNAGADVGIIMANEEPNRDAPIQVASIQTLQRRGYNHLPEADWVMVDECHRHNAAYHELANRYPNSKFLGFTATPVGAGGARLTLFDKIVEPIKNSELIRDGFLLPVDPYLAPSEPDLTGIDLKNAKQVGERVKECTVYGYVFDIWEPYKHMQTFALLPNVALAYGFEQQCKARGISARVIEGSTSTIERVEAFAEFKEEDTQMLIGVDVLKEGVDCPNAQCLLNLQPTHQVRVHIQAIGRVKRPHVGQKSAVVIDLAGNIWRHWIHPDHDPPWEELTNDTSIEEIIDKKAGRKCPNCGSRDIYTIPGKGLKCEDCKHEWAQPKPPWICPSCSQMLAPHQKIRDGCCPNCGAKIGKPIRRIRYEDGSVRPIPAEEIKHRKKSKENAEQAAWFRWLEIANRANHKKGNEDKPKKTLSFVRAMYKKDMGKYPDDTLHPKPPEWSSGDWSRHPHMVYDYLARKVKK